MVEASQECATSARVRLSVALTKAQERGKVDSSQEVLERISVRTGLPPPDAELYVEAVPEEVDTKRAVLQRLPGLPHRMR